VKWPLELKSETLDDPENLKRFARRHEVQCRRVLVRRLEMLFKRAKRRNFKRGEGFWIGLHLWFVPGLTRDTGEEDTDFEEGTIVDEVIGPPYHKVLPRPARHYFHRVMKALEVDLIFVEDGVPFRRFRRVLDCLFEVFDISGDTRRAEEKHFVGIPGIRVVIHDFDPDSPYRSGTYPEPDYEDIGRARILHVFVDRGGADEPVDVPVDSESEPVLQHS
jgi:hypothetical protein